MDAAKRSGHTTYRHRPTEKLVHTKLPDIGSDWEPLNEVCVQELSTLVSASHAPATIAVFDNPEGKILGTASYALFETPFNVQNGKQTFSLSSIDRNALCKINVLSGWVNNLDGDLRHLAIGSSNRSGAYMFYAFDSSHTGYGPDGRSNVLSITVAFWLKGYVHFSLNEYMDVVKIIEGIPDDIIKSKCLLWGSRIDDVMNTQKYSALAENLADLYVKRKYKLRPAVLEMLA